MDFGALRQQILNIIDWLRDRLWAFIKGTFDKEENPEATTVGDDIWDN